MRGKEDRGRAMKEEKREWKREGKGFPQKPNLRRRYIRTCFLGFCQHECPCSSWVCRCLQVQFLPYYYSYLEPTAGWCRYVAFHRGLQVSIDGHLGDSDVNLETFILFLSHTSARFYLSLQLGFFGCFQQFMHICHARHYSTLRNVHYWKRRRRKIISMLSNINCFISTVHHSNSNRLTRAPMMIWYK